MMRAKWCVVLFFVFAWVMVVNWCSGDAATGNMPYFASEVGSSDSVASLVVNTTYYIGLGIDNELYPSSTIYIKTSPRYIDSDGNVSYGVSTESITKPKRQDDAYKNYRYWISASFSEAGVFMIEPRIVFANGSDYDWDPILISVVDRSPEVYQNLSSQTVLEGTAVTFTANAYAGTNLKYQWYYANSSTAEGEAISGAVEDSYVVEASAKTAGYYYCCVSNSCAAVFTNRASVTPIYVISYHANGGSKEPAGQLKTHGYTLVLDHAKPVREGYIFRGWSEDSASNVPTYLNGSSYSEERSVMFFAVWEKEVEEEPAEPIVSATPTPTPVFTPTPTPASIFTSTPYPNATPSKESPTPTRKPDVSISVQPTEVPVATPTMRSDNMQPDNASSNKPAASPNVIAGGNQVEKSNGQVVQRGHTFKAVVIKQLKSSSRRKISLKWKRNKMFFGYQVHFSERKDFKRKTFERFFGKGQTKTSIVGLKSGKVFYFKIRGYKRMGNKRYYGKWSVVKKVKVR